MKNFFLKLLYALLVGSLLVSCASKNQETTDDATEESTTALSALKDEVMAVHDEAMAKMGEMQTLESDIKTHLSGLDSAENASIIEEGMQKVQALSQASEGMMQWMRNYEPPSSETPQAEAEAYLQQQKEAVTKVQEAIDQSLEEAKAFLTQQKSDNTSSEE